jgi:hypothetical protein
MMTPTTTDMKQLLHLLLEVSSSSTIFTEDSVVLKWAFQMGDDHFLPYLFPLIT